MVDRLEDIIGALGSLANSLSNKRDPYSTGLSATFLSETYLDTALNTEKFFENNNRTTRVINNFMQCIKEDFEEFEKRTRLLVYQSLNYSRSDIIQLVDSNDTRWALKIRNLNEDLVQNRNRCILSLEKYNIIKNYQPMQLIH